MRKRITKLGPLLLAVLVCPVPLGAVPTGVGEAYDVKAAFVYKFLFFVEWPPGSTAVRDGGHRICVFEAGTSSAAPVFAELLTGKRVDEAPLSLRFFSDSTETLEDCTVLFITGEMTGGGRDVTRRKELLSRAYGSPILTIGEGDGFLAAGGMIQLAIRQSRVRFAIELDNVNAAKLMMSFQLLRLSESAPAVKER